MATYNGEAFIEEQIKSIINQTYSEWKLFIRDDMSSDNTINIIKTLCNKDKRIMFIEAQSNVKQCQNFSILLNYVNNYDLVFFADQDDYWYPDKLEIILRYYEKMRNKKTPMLIYTNYYNSNQNLKNKKIAYNKKMENIDNISNRLFVQNWILGCTMAINGAALSLSCNIPKFVHNHDEWIARIVAANGNVFYINEPTIIHRIHESNVTTNQDTRKINVRLIRLLKSMREGEKRIEYDKKFVNAMIKRSNEVGYDFPEVLAEYESHLNKRGMATLKGILLKKYLPFNLVQKLIYLYQRMGA